ncbi:MAG: NAD(+) diphosphatase [Polyangiaceae bacterium]
MEPKVFAFTRSGVLLVGADAPRAPTRRELEGAGVSLAGARSLPGAEDAFVWLGDTEAEGLRAVGMRSLFGVWEHADLERAFLASQLAHFDRMTAFCGQCSARTAWKPGPEGVHVKVCAACDHDFYPAIAPCAIVLVADGDRVLLTRKAIFPGGFYGLVAGFLEPAETLEACAAREVLEETGVRIRDVRYFGSQPWPFPSQLMVGFTATYDGGDIVVDRTELEDARWFHRDELPKLPPPQSIARRLIEAWRAP